MEEQRIHRAVSDDGTEIAGRIYGQGPPLVLIHGAMADGELEWGELLPWLTDRFTCYVPSMRGRGLSGAHPDLSREARVRDVAAFVESIGEPVGLVGVSGGGMLALGTAARTSAVTAVVASEPVVFEVLSEEVLAGFWEAVGRMAAAAEQGRAAEAAGTFLALIANDEEVAALSADPEGLEAVAQYVPVDLEELREAFEFDGPSPTDPSVLQQIAVPTLLLHGSRTALSWFTDSTRHAAEHVPDATVREITDIGHLGHLVHPDRVAGELIAFLAAAPEPA
ncbi:MAG: alpha/beta fold hydrolase [Pseudonocardiaceae bacterium]|nr:alpha/beta fold hydrolase [Pseudonocardiaceae bacterium]